MNGPAFWIPPICLSHSSLPAPFLPLSAPSVPTLCPLPTIRGLLSLSRFSVPVPPKPPVSPFHSDPSVPPPCPLRPRVPPSVPPRRASSRFSARVCCFRSSSDLKPLSAPLRSSSPLLPATATPPAPSRPLLTPPGPCSAHPVVGLSPTKARQYLVRARSATPRSLVGQPEGKLIPRRSDGNAFLARPPPPPGSRLPSPPRVQPSPSSPPSRGFTGRSEDEDRQPSRSGSGRSLGYRGTDRSKSTRLGLKEASSERA